MKRYCTSYSLGNGYRIKFYDYDQSKRLDSSGFVTFPLISVINLSGVGCYFRNTSCTVMLLLVSSMCMYTLENLCVHSMTFANVCFQISNFSKKTYFLSNIMGINYKCYFPITAAVDLCIR